MGDVTNIHLGVHSGEPHNRVDTHQMASTVEVGTGDSTMGILIDYVSGHFPIVALLILIFCGIFYLAWIIRGFIGNLETTSGKVDSNEKSIVDFKTVNEEQHKELAHNQHEFERETNKTQKEMFVQLGKNGECLARIEGFIQAKT